MKQGQITRIIGRWLFVGALVGIGMGLIVGLAVPELLTGLLGNEIYQGDSPFSALDPAHRQRVSLRVGATLGCINGLLIGAGLGIANAWLVAWVHVKEQGQNVRGD